MTKHFDIYVEKELQCLAKDIAESGFVIENNPIELDSDMELSFKLLKEIDRYRLNMIEYARVIRRLENKNKRLREQKHIYKVELGRCQRKLEKIYKRANILNDDLMFNVYSYHQMMCKLHTFLQFLKSLNKKGGK